MTKQEAKPKTETFKALMALYPPTNTRNSFQLALVLPSDANHNFDIERVGFRVIVEKDTITFFSVKVGEEKRAIYFHPFKNGDGNGYSWRTQLSDNQAPSIKGVFERYGTFGTSESEVMMDKNKDGVISICFKIPEARNDIKKVTRQPKEVEVSQSTALDIKKLQEAKDTINLAAKDGVTLSVEGNRLSIRIDI